MFSGLVELDYIKVLGISISPGIHMFLQIDRRQAVCDSDKMFRLFLLTVRMSSNGDVYKTTPDKGTLKLRAMGLGLGYHLGNRLEFGKLSGICRIPLHPREERTHSTLFFLLSAVDDSGKSGMS